MAAVAQVRLVERGSLQQERAQLAKERAELNQGLSQVGAWHPTIRDHLRHCRALRLMLSGPVPGPGWVAPPHAAPKHSVVCISPSQTSSLHIPLWPLS